MPEPLAIPRDRIETSHLPGEPTADLSITWEATEGTIARSWINHRSNGGGWLEDVMHPEVAQYTHNCRVNLDPGDVVEWYAKVLVSYDNKLWPFEVPIVAVYGAVYGGNLSALPVSPIGKVGGNRPYLIAEVGGAPSGLHGRFLVGLYGTFTKVDYELKSVLDQSEWERAAPPYTEWVPLGPEGANNGDRIRVRAPALRYDTYFWEAQVWTGDRYGPYSALTYFDVEPAADPPLACTIGNQSYEIEGLVVTEQTGGGAGEVEFRIPAQEYKARPFDLGAPVAVGLRIRDRHRGWNATVESAPEQKGAVTVHCLQDDALLARRLVESDFDFGDVGINLSLAVDFYGGPLSSLGIDTDLGLKTPLVGAYKSLYDHLKEWADRLDLLLYVGEGRVIHLVDPAHLPEPQVILYEEYD